MEGHRDSTEHAAGMYIQWFDQDTWSCVVRPSSGTLDTVIYMNQLLAVFSCL